MPRRRELAARDQERTGFTAILERLLDAVPGAIGVCLVDNQGESVDYAGLLEPFEVRLVAAHMQHEHRLAGGALQAALGTVKALTVRAQKRSFAVRSLIDGYVVVVVFSRCAGFGLSERAVAQAEYELRVEAGWQPPPGLERWVHAHVQARASNRWRPARLRCGTQWTPLEVLGAVMGLGPGERGYRVRTEAGVELTLVRERHGRWYADTEVDAARDASQTSL